MNKLRVFFAIIPLSGCEHFIYKSGIERMTNKKSEIRLIMGGEIIRLKYLLYRRMAKLTFMAEIYTFKCILAVDYLLQAYLD